MIVLTPGRHSELLTSMVMVIYQVKTSSHSLRNKYYIYFRENHLPVFDQEVEFLIFSYSNQDKILAFRDFLKLILPRNNIDLREICVERRRINVKG